MVITELQEKLITTKRGPAKKFVVKTDDGKTFDSFVNDWNQNWTVGMAINIDPSQWTSREYMGKMYYSVGAPKMNTFQSAPTPANQPSNEIPVILPDASINAISRDIRSNHEQVMAELHEIKEKIGQAEVDKIPF